MLIKEHHRQTAEEFRQWLRLNPATSRRRRTIMFNTFADANFYESIKFKPKKKKIQKSQKFIKRT